MSQQRHSDISIIGFVTGDEFCVLVCNVRAKEVELCWTIKNDVAWAKWQMGEVVNGQSGCGRSWLGAKWKIGEVTDVATFQNVEHFLQRYSTLNAAGVK